MTAVCCLAALCVLLGCALLGTALTLRRARAENRRLRDILSLSAQRDEGEELRRLRHDLRHYLVAGGCAPEAIPPELLRDTTGPALSMGTLVERYREQALALGVRTDLQLELEPCVTALLPDLCLVVSNLLENAVESLRREGGGWLRARCVCTEGYIALVVGNSCAQPLRRAGDRYLSGKAEGRFGLGLSIVEEIARRHGGEARFSSEEGRFLASVFLLQPLADPEGEPAPAVPNAERAAVAAEKFS